MPLVNGHSREAIGENIRRLHLGDGRPLNQSVAIALRLAHQSAVNHRASGGYNPPSPSLEEREYLRDEDSRPFSGGLINSAIPGRTDRHNIDVPSGSYVLPADVVSGLGEGNTMAGAAVVQKMFGTAPYGVPLAHGSGGGGGSYGHMPSPPPPFREPASPPVTFAAGGMPHLASAPMPARAPVVSGIAPHAPALPTRMPGNPMTPRVMRPVQASPVYHGGAAGPPMAQAFAMGGGASEGHENGWVPIVAAGGEIVISPSIVKNHPLLGRGSLHRGHQILDEFVKQRRAKTIKQLKSLPGPAK
jgi:hypothetical protein